MRCLKKIALKKAGKIMSAEQQSVSMSVERDVSDSTFDGVGSQKPSVRRSIQLVSIWSGIPMVILLFVGLWPIAGFIPPLHPSASALEIANTYRTEGGMIRVGLAISFLSIILLFPFGAAIAAQTRRIEGSLPTLTYIQVAGLASGSLIFIIPWVCWIVAAFRPERLDSDILLLNDLGWMTFVLSFVAFFAWLAAIGVAILSDESKKPIYPRWAGYLNLFVAISFFPDILIPFFKSGIFSWAGLFPFYLPFATYFIWILVMIWLTDKAIKNDPTLNR